MNEDMRGIRLYAFMFTPCPFCHAEMWQGCRTMAGKPTRRMHKARITPWCHNAKGAPQR